MRDQLAGRKAREYLNSPNAPGHLTPFGLVISKGNLFPSNGVSRIVVEGLPLNLEKRLFHERVSLIKKDVPIRSHEETDQEIVRNIGDTSIWYILPEELVEIKPGEARYTVNKGVGFFHGYGVNEHESGLLYVAKALFPDFVDGDSFKIPKNTYKN